MNAMPRRLALLSLALLQGCYSPHPSGQLDANSDATLPDATRTIDAIPLVPGINVSDLTGNTDEKGQTATFQLVLNSVPTSNVTVHFASDNDAEAITNVTSLTFTPADAMQAQMVTVTGVDDGIADGTQAVHIVFTSTTSNDSRYANIVPQPRAFNNLDNGRARVCLTLDEYLDGTLSCPTGRVVGVIDFASYGNPAGMCGSFALGSCHATQSAAVVAAACVTHASCMVAAQNAVFGDPCLGINKRLYIQATCQ